MTIGLSSATVGFNVGVSTSSGIYYTQPNSTLYPSLFTSGTCSVAYASYNSLITLNYNSAVLDLSLYDCFLTLYDFGSFGVHCSTACAGLSAG